MFERSKLRMLGDVGLIALVAVGCILPVLFLGPPTGPGDLYHHMQIAGAYVDSFKAGIFMPSWIDGENGGYGSVTVRFYPPLAHYSIAAFKILLGSWHLATFAAFALWSFIGSLGCYLWAKDVVRDRVGAVAAAFLFALAPYHLNQYYNSFMWAEFVALSILPFAFLFTRRLLATGRTCYVLALGCSYALLVLSNLPQLIIGSVGIFIYSIFLLDKDKIANSLKLAGSIALGLALSAYYWVRMTAEMNWLVVAQPNTDPMYDFRNHFLFAGVSLDDRFVWFASLFLGISVVTIVVAFVASGKVSAAFRERDLRGVSAILIGALILMVPVSQPLWEFVSPLQRIQFPWRLLSLVGLAAAMIVGYAVSKARAGSNGSQRARLLVLAGLVAITATFSIKQIVLGALYTDARSFEIASDKMAAAPNLEHWLPTWTAKSSFADEAAVQTRSRSSSIKDWEGVERHFSLDPGDAEQVRLGLMYYPHWRATLNDAPAEIKIADGAVAIDVGTEPAVVSLKFVEPWYTLASCSISVVSWVAVFVGFIFLILRNRTIKIA